MDSINNIVSNFFKGENLVFILMILLSLV